MGAPLLVHFAVQSFFLALAVIEGLGHAVLESRIVHLAVYFLTFFVHLAMDFISFTVQLSVDFISLVIQPFFDPITLAVQMVGQALFAMLRSPV